MEGFESLVKNTYPMIYKICRVYAGQEDFDDLYQEILINLWRSYNSFKGDSKQSTWLYRVALNTALTYRRNATRKSQNIVRLESIAVKDPYDQEQNDDQVEALYKAISQLRRDERSLILLYLEEKSYEEMAEITGWSVSNVGVRINRTKKKLYQLLKSDPHE